MADLFEIAWALSVPRPGSSPARMIREAGSIIRAFDQRRYVVRCAGQAYGSVATRCFVYAGILPAPFACISRLRS